MVEWTPENWLALAALISTAVGAFSIKPIIDSIIRIGDWLEARKVRAVERVDKRAKLAQELADARIDRDYKQTIMSQNKRIQEQKSELEELRAEIKELHKCIAVLEAAVARYDEREKICQRDLAEVKERLEKLESCKPE